MGLQSVEHTNRLHLSDNADCRRQTGGPGCAAEAGHTYSTRFSASSAFTNVRLPFNVFRPQRGAPPQWDPADASHISIRRDARPPDTVLGGPSGAVETNSLEAGAFHLEVLRIKVMQACGYHSASVSLSA